MLRRLPDVIQNIRELQTVVFLISQLGASLFCTTPCGKVWRRIRERFDNSTLGCLGKVETTTKIIQEEHDFWIPLKSYYNENGVENIDKYGIRVHENK
ncbi:unnamed protein product [Caenorhabditis brenneri]